MAKINPHRYECDDCEKPFKNPQAVRGHLRHCPHRRLRLQAGTQAEAEPAPSPVMGREARRSGPDSQDSKLLLLDTREHLQDLRQNAGHFSAMGNILAGMNVPGAYEKAKAWLQVAQALDDVERDYEQMVGLLQLDRSVLFRLYQQMRGIRGMWRDCRTCQMSPTEAGEADSEYQQACHDEDARWDTIMTNIKKMLVASR